MPWPARQEKVSLPYGELTSTPVAANAGAAESARMAETAPKTFIMDLHTHVPREEQRATHGTQQSYKGHTRV